jgi:hypothetical protein
MNPRTIDAIRDCALRYENNDLQVAYELMQIAHINRPSGLFIEKKYLNYKEQLESEKKRLEPKTEGWLQLIKLVDNGDVAIIPIGFRCFTAKMIEKKLGIQQESFPFNSGFFSPNSVASVLKNPKINLQFNDQGKTHAVCIKTEMNVDSDYGLGIKFNSSSYEEINSRAKNRDVKGINSLLDSTFGYYTLDRSHKFVLAHYNWHEFAGKSKSNGITSPAVNLVKINETLNKRISRMFERCSKAKHIYFIFGEEQGYKYMQIDDIYQPLDDFSELDKVCREIYGSKFSILNIEDIETASELVAKLT